MEIRVQTRSSIKLLNTTRNRDGRPERHAESGGLAVVGQKTLGANSPLCDSNELDKHVGRVRMRHRHRVTLHPPNPDRIDRQERSEYGAIIRSAVPVSLVPKNTSPACGSCFCENGLVKSDIARRPKAIANSVSGNARLRCSMTGALLLTSRWAHYRIPEKITPEVLFVGFRSFSSVLVGWRLDHASVGAWPPCECAHVLLPSDRGSDSGLQREQDCWRDCATDEILRLEANPRKDLVCANHSADAGHLWTVVCADAPDGGATSGSAVFPSGANRPVRCVLHRRSWRGVGLVGIRHRPDAGAMGRAASQHFTWLRVGRLVHRAVYGGSSSPRMDLGAMPLHGGGPRSYRLALQ